MVRLEPPELIRVTDRIWLVPILTLPRASVLGETLSCPLLIPFPETGTLTVVDTVFNATVVRSRFRPPSGLFGRFIETVPTTEIVPLAEPPEAGVKLTLARTLCPAFSFRG